MKYIVLSSLLALSCATVKQNPYAYEEMDSCPASMDEQQHLSGVVRCRAMCSSYGRDFAEYGGDCRCYCAPASPVFRQPAPQKRSQPWASGQT